MPQSDRVSLSLAALRQGEITLEDYLRARVKQALAPWVSRLTPRQLRRVGAVLEARLRADPLLSQYVQRLTGEEPGSPPASGPGSVR